MEILKKFWLEKYGVRLLKYVSSTLVKREEMPKTAEEVKHWIINSLDSMEIGNVGQVLLSHYGIDLVDEIMKYGATVELPYNNDVPSAMREMHRILKDLAGIVPPCNHRDYNGIPLIEYDSPVEMRSSDMHCAVCGKQGSREELMAEVDKNEDDF
jgi:hypothetical protein